MSSKTDISRRAISPPPKVGRHIDWKAAGGKYEGILRDLMLQDPNITPKHVYSRLGDAWKSVSNNALTQKLKSLRQDLQKSDRSSGK